MTLNLEKIGKSLALEYVILDRNAIVRDFSSGAPLYHSNLQIGQPWGWEFSDDLETIFAEIIQGKRESYKTSTLARNLTSDRSSPDIDLHFLRDENSVNSDERIIVFVEKRKVPIELEQKFIQKSNEVSLLAMAWSSSQAYLDKIINSMADALIVTNASGAIKKLNPATEEMFGYHASELLDRKISLLLPSDSEFPIFEHPVNSTDVEVDRNLELSCRTKADEEIIVEFSCAKIPTDIEDSPDFVCLGKDITKRVQAEFKLRQTLEKEKEINNLKSQFVSMTSHELRTPLNTILFASELLKSSGDEEREELLEAIEVNIKRLTELVDYVSLVGKTEIETVELKKSKLNLVEFCRSLVNEIKLSTGNTSQLNFVSKAKRVEANVDRKILRHTLKSLLVNVVKYLSKQGTIEVKISQTQDDIRFRVEVRGSALPIGDREKLLESCYNSGSLSKIPETGLGLAIAQKYARLQGGRIEVNNSPEETIFNVILPLADTSNSSAF
ncbi:MAG: PAS domain-containing sensor histidine kinase [Cyanobacteriota bacterium]|nr:PAS domain-containing sensor histidine kinase [Cyanobacteriota bacterium]